MRHFIDIVEGAEWAPERMSPKEIAEFARFHEGENQTENTDDFDWHYDPAFPISDLEDGAASLADWMKEELGGWAKDGEPNRYDNMFDRPIEEPIVLHVDENGVGRIWDGWHRSGASAMRGLPTVPAFVGTRKTDSARNEGSVLQEAKARVLFHVTLTKNLPSIREHGLVPKIGTLSALAGEPKPAIYLFYNLVAVEDALTNWLGDHLPDDEPLALLKVRLPPGIKADREENEFSYECQVYEPIPPSCIEVMSENVDEDVHIFDD